MYFGELKKQFYGLIKILKFFDPGSGTEKFRFKMEKIRIRDKYSGFATLTVLPLHKSVLANCLPDL